MIETILALDEAAISLVSGLQNDFLTILMLAITFLGNPLFWFFVVAWLYWKGEENRSFFLAGLIVFASALTGALKIGIARPRPSFKNVDLLIGEYLSNYSFPSGHATMAGAAFSFFRGKRKTIALGLLVLGVMISRVYLGVHFPSDVIVGAGIGLASGVAFKRFEIMVQKKIRLSRRKDEAAIAIIIGLGLIAMLMIKPAPIIGILLGYIFGFFAFKGINTEQKTLLGRAAAVKQAGGFAVLGIILASTQFAGYGFSFALFLLSGLWVSLLWPLAFEKIYK